MKKIKLGISCLEVSTIGLGCMGMSLSFGVNVDKKQSIDLIRKVVEPWCNLLWYCRDIWSIYQRRACWRSSGTIRKVSITTKLVLTSGGRV
jgi:hypothetical protein